jgi:carbon storage regulator
MLMISRRVGERIVIGGDVEVTITEIHRRTVRIAIKTGKAQKVLRGEVFDSVERANRLAAESVIDEESLGAIPAAAPAPAPVPVPVAMTADKESAPTAQVSPPAPSSGKSEEAAR